MAAHAGGAVAAARHRAVPPGRGLPVSVVPERARSGLRVGRSRRRGRGGRHARVRRPRLSCRRRDPVVPSAAAGETDRRVLRAWPSVGRRRRRPRPPRPAPAPSRGGARAMRIGARRVCADGRDRRRHRRHRSDRRRRSARPRRGRSAGPRRRNGLPRRRNVRRAEGVQPGASSSGRGACRVSCPEAAARELGELRPSPSARLGPEGVGGAVVEGVGGRSRSGSGLVRSWVMSALQGAGRRRGRIRFPGPVATGPAQAGPAPGDARAHRAHGDAEVISAIAA